MSGALKAPILEVQGRDAVKTTSSSIRLDLTLPATEHTPSKMLNVLYFFG
jgi:hypothetical protein